MSDSFKYPAYSSEVANGGLIGYANTAEFICNDNTPTYITFGDHTRTFNIVKSSFSVLDNVKVLKPRIHNEKALLFIIATWKKQIPNIGYARHWKIAKECSLSLPTKNNQIDIEFMESFIAELEARCIAELEAYLTATGLKDYTLSEEEEQSLLAFKTMQWGEYRMGDLFNKIETAKIPYKASDLPKEPIGQSILPCLTSSFNNQGLNYYIPKNDATVLKNVISIPSNSDVYRAYYQSREFTVLSDAYAIRWARDDREITAKQYLFMVMCINKVTDLPIYSYKNKLGGWNVVKNKNIQLPTKYGKIDFEFMDRFISAIQKLSIKDVVLYTERKIKMTKYVVGGNK